MENKSISERSNGVNPKLDRESQLFLHALKEDGIEHLYMPKQISTAKKTSETAGLTGGLSSKDSLLKLRDEALACTRCSELSKTRNSVVFGSGNVKARLMFVGEAPGADEDLQGLPFVGRAGQLLTKIIESIGFDRKQVFIANVLKCRPPKNRPPAPDEIINCQGYLFRQIEIIHPEIICCLGTFAAQTLLKTQDTIGSLRGKTFELYNAKLVCTYHPAYLLRNPNDKRKVWEDMKRIKKMLDATSS